MPDVVEIYCGPDHDRFGETRFGMVGEPVDFCDGRLVREAPPLMLIVAADVAAALAPGGDTSYGGVVSTATPEGMFRIDSRDGSWIWELFPLVWSDGVDTPSCYLGVWRD